MPNKKLRKVKPMPVRGSRSSASVSHARALLKVQVQHVREAVMAQVELLLEANRKSGTVFDESVFKPEVLTFLDERGRAAIRAVVIELGRTRYDVDETTMRALTAGIGRAVTQIYDAVLKRVQTEPNESVAAIHVPQLKQWPAKRAKAG